MQGIDARDLAAFLILGVEQGLTGVHNADGLPTPLGALLDLCAAEAPAPASVTWVDPETWKTFTLQCSNPVIRHAGKAT